MRFAERVIASGAIASVASAAAAALCSRFENGHAARPINAIAHIYDGGMAPARDGRGRNTALGVAIHTAASVWWALFFEALPEKHRHVTGAAGVAAAAYVVDYHVVHRRFRPGFEAHLSSASLAAIYGALALGFAAAARLNRRLYHHQKENRDERDERRPAERRPDRVIAPELAR